MTMTAEEIVRHWRQAKNQNNQELQVLAELNQTDRDAIRTILKNAGEALPNRLKGQELREAMEALYGQKLSDGEIAQRLGCSKATVAKWRKERGLPWNAEPGFPQKKAQAFPVAAAALPEVYGQIETILAALPESASRLTRRQAGYLISNMLWEYLDEVLRLKEEGTT